MRTPLMSLRRNRKAEVVGALDREWSFPVGTMVQATVTIRNNTDETYTGCLMYAGTDEMGNFAQGFEFPPGEKTVKTDAQNPIGETTGTFNYYVTLWDGDYNEIIPRTKVGTVSIEEAQRIVNLTVIDIEPGTDKCKVRDSYSGQTMWTLIEPTGDKVEWYNGELAPLDIDYETVPWVVHLTMTDIEPGTDNIKIKDKNSPGLYKEEQWTVTKPTTGSYVRWYGIEWVPVGEDVVLA